jgi:hypothetical protein
MALENKARQFPLNVLHSACRVFVFGEAAGAKEIVCVPRGSFVKQVHVSVTEAFNGTGAALDIGIAGTPAGLAASANVGLATAGYKGAVTAGALCGDNFFASDTVIIGTFAPGTGGTTGRAKILIEFYPQQD